MSGFALPLLATGFSVAEGGSGTCTIHAVSKAFSLNALASTVQWQATTTFNSHHSKRDGTDLSICSASFEGGPA